MRKLTTRQKISRTENWEIYKLKGFIKLVTHFIIKLPRKDYDLAVEHKAYFLAYLKAQVDFLRKKQKVRILKDEKDKLL